jgi:hypothetical protein
MAIRVIEGEFLSTTWDDGPAVSVITRPSGNPTDLVIEYVSAIGGKRKTRITFANVYQYSWIDEFVDRDPNVDDFEFGLIEVLDSELIRRMIQFSPYRDAPEGMRLGGVLKEFDLHHYRIGFDDHGTYDVVCTDLSVDVLDVG